MDEEKRKYLEELRKQIDPEILSKMANYLGNDGDGAVASVGMAGNPSSESAQSSFASSAADKLRERRAMQFQERVARRKRQDVVEQPDVQGAPDEKKEILVYANNDLWGRIIENQFKQVGFSASHVFTDFPSLIRRLLEWSKEKRDAKVAVAVAFQEIASFLHAWEHLRRESEQQPQFAFLHDICYFFVAEYKKQIQEALIERIGNDRIICITDEINTNREKIERTMISGDMRSEE